MWRVKRGPHMKTNEKQDYALFVCARLISAALLIWAFGRHRYIFYQLVKLIVVGVTVYGVYYTYKFQTKFWMVYLSQSLSYLIHLYQFI